MQKSQESGDLKGLNRKCIWREWFFGDQLIIYVELSIFGWSRFLPGSHTKCTICIFISPNIELVANPSLEAHPIHCHHELMFSSEVKHTQIIFEQMSVVLVTLHRSSAQQIFRQVGQQCTYSLACKVAFTNSLWILLQSMHENNGKVFQQYAFGHLNSCRWGPISWKVYGNFHLVQCTLKWIFHKRGPPCWVQMVQMII